MGQILTVGWLRPCSLVLMPAAEWTPTAGALRPYSPSLMLAAGWTQMGSAFRKHSPRWMPEAGPIPTADSESSFSGEPEALIIASPEEVSQDATRQFGGGFIALGGFLEQLQSRQSLPMHSLGLEDLC